MANYSKLLLSQSTNGRGVLITATSTPGTIVHTSVLGTSDFDEIWLYANCATGSSQKLTLEWGSTAPYDDIDVFIVGGDGLHLVVPGLILNNGASVRAFSPLSSTMTIFGWVNRITT